MCGRCTFRHPRRMSDQTIAATPSPPYVAVIFTSVRTDDDSGYAAMAAAMERLAREQPGYLGIEAAREGVGITVSYWRGETGGEGGKEGGAQLVAPPPGRGGGGPRHPRPTPPPPPRHGP